jgi:hypothetical protein
MVYSWRISIYSSQKNIYHRSIWYGPNTAIMEKSKGSNEGVILLEEHAYAQFGSIEFLRNQLLKTDGPSNETVFALVLETRSSVS